MSRLLSPQTRRALELLADGEWHDYKKVVSEIAMVIPPGIGARRAEANRRNLARRKGYNTVDVRQFEIGALELARIGAKSIARQTLNGNRYFEIEPRGECGHGVTRRVRLKPGVVVER